MNNLRRMLTWQYFCGYRYYIKEKNPFERSLLSVFRKKIGEQGAVQIFQTTSELGLQEGVLKPSDVKKIHVDTTVQDKNIAYPHSAKLLKEMIKKLRKVAKKNGIDIRQSYKRVSHIYCLRALRYSNARQFNRMRRCIKKLTTFLGRLYRDIERKVRNTNLQELFEPLITLAKRIRHQSTTKVPSSEYIYSLHERHVACICKGKSHKKYEFGNKVSLAITDRSRFIIGCDIFSGNPHDSKTLLSVVSKIESATSTSVNLIGVDLGYRGSGVKGAVHARLKKVSKAVKKFVRSHPKIEAVISHAKRKFHLGLSRLKGLAGDTINCLLAASAYNFSLIMRRRFSTNF
jgi:transposase, IS5 family